MTPYTVEVKLPGDLIRFNSVQPAPILGVDGYWYLLIYGRTTAESGPRQHVYKWKPGIVAERVPMPPATDARGSIGAHASGGALFAWQGSGEYPRLMCNEVAGFAPADAPGVAELRARVTALETQQSADLSLSDRSALEALKRMIGAI